MFKSHKKCEVLTRNVWTADRNRDNHEGQRTWQNAGDRLSVRQIDENPRAEFD